MPTWEVIHGDCLKVLPTLAGIDAVITDPPYGIGYDGINHGCTKDRGIYSGHREIASRIKQEAEIQSDDKPFDPTPFLFAACCFTGAQYFYDRLPAGGSLHCWNKKGLYKPMDHGDCDMVWSSIKRCPRIFDLVWRGLCRHAEQNERFVHPTQKPVALMAWCMEMAKVPEGATVLDPYCGSGSTGVACMETGRNFIGIEIDAGYCEIARKRIGAAAKQGRLELVG